MSTEVLIAAHDGLPNISYKEVIENASLARAYVPFQRFYGICAPDVSLKRGTVFAELDMPHERREHLGFW